MYKIVIATLVIVAIINFNTTHNTNKEYTLSNTKDLKTGDIIFRKENNFISTAFSKVDNSIYSHIGIIDVQDSNIFVYHMEYDGTDKDLKIDKLNKFLQYAEKVKVYRYKYKLNTKKLEKILKEYQKSNLKFDFDFKLDNSDIYCTEFVNNIYFELTNKNIYSYLYTYQNKQIISIKSILTNQKSFNEIKIFLYHKTRLTK